MKRKIAIALVIPFLFGLTGCESYLRDRSESFAPKDLPDGCVALYAHKEGDVAESDDYRGVYCPIDVEYGQPTP